MREANRRALASLFKILASQENPSDIVLIASDEEFEPRNVRTSEMDCGVSRA